MIKDELTKTGDMKTKPIIIAIRKEANGKFAMSGRNTTASDLIV